MSVRNLSLIQKISVENDQVAYCVRVNRSRSRKEVQECMLFQSVHVGTCKYLWCQEVKGYQAEVQN